MNDAPSEPQRDYRDTVFLPQTGFPMRGDLPKKEPQILARWEAMDLWSKLRAASQRSAESSSCTTGRPMRTATSISAPR